MDKANRNNNVRIISRWHGYYIEDMECRWCKYYQGKKRGCKLETCCFEDEKLDAIANKRIKRERREQRWDL